jgi:ArsR family transcriptional regulator
MTSLDAAVGLLGLLADPTRVRLLSLLEHGELTVAEMVAVTELAQSRVSTHLGKLKDGAFLRVRPAGNATFYGVSETMPDEARAVWAVVRERLSDATLKADYERSRAVIEARAGGGSWLDAVAGEMERHYSPGRTWESLCYGLAGTGRFGDVLDVGSGDGFVAGLFAPHARSVTCVDVSERMIAAAKDRLSAFGNVRVAVADMHELPFESGSFDHVALFSVLPYSKDPPRALREAARVLRVSGILSVITLAPHQSESVTAPYGHVTAGFAPEQLRPWLRKAGLEVEHCARAARERRAPHFEVVAATAVKRQKVSERPS